MLLFNQKKHALKLSIVLCMLNILKSNFLLPFRAVSIKATLVTVVMMSLHFDLVSHNDDDSFC